MKVQIVESDKEFKHAIDSLERLMLGIDLDGNMREDFVALLVGSGIHRLQQRDIYRHICAADNVKMIEATSLHGEQKACFNYGLTAKGPVSLVQGGAGTGKTRFVTEIIDFYLKASNKLQVLFVAPENNNVDDVAVQLQARIDQLRGDNLAANKYVVRLHSSETEKDIYLRRAKLNKARPANARPLRQELSTQDRDLLRGMKFSEALFQKHHEATQVTFSLNHDPRVKHIELSLSTRLLQTCGILPNGPMPADPQTWQCFVTLYRQYRSSETNEDFPTEQKKQLAVEMRALRDHVIKQADVVCATVCNAAEKSNADVLKLSTKHVIVEEAARVQEHLMLPLLMIQFVDNSGFTMIGDPYQNGPMTMSKKESNPFRDLLAPDTMSRLAKTGLPINQFKVQHRMLPDISAISNIQVYRGLIRDDPELLVAARNPDSIAAKVIVFNRAHYQKPRSVIFHDLQVPEGALNNGTDVMHGRIRYNEKFVQYGINLIAALLEAIPKAEIGYITGYRGQLRLLLSAKAVMMHHRVPGAENVKSWT